MAHRTFLLRLLPTTTHHPPCLRDPLPFSPRSLPTHGEDDSLEEPIPDGRGERLIGRADKGPWSLSAHETGSSHIVVGAGPLALAVWRPAPPPPGAGSCTTRSRDRTSREPIRGSTQACLGACARHTDAAFAECDDPDAWPTQGHAGDRCDLGSSKGFGLGQGWSTRNGSRFAYGSWGAPSTASELRWFTCRLPMPIEESEADPLRVRRGVRFAQSTRSGRQGEAAA